MSHMAPQMPPNPTQKGFCVVCQEHRELTSVQYRVCRDCQDDMLRPRNDGSGFTETLGGWFLVAAALVLAVVSAYALLFTMRNAF